jgi:hypothetical protein
MVALRRHPPRCAPDGHPPRRGVRWRIKRLSRAGVSAIADDGLRVSLSVDSASRVTRVLAEGELELACAPFADECCTDARSGANAGLISGGLLAPFVGGELRRDGMIAARTLSAHSGRSPFG